MLVLQSLLRFHDPNDSGVQGPFAHLVDDLFRLLRFLGGIGLLDGIDVKFVFGVRKGVVEAETVVRFDVFPCSRGGSFQDMSFGQSERLDGEDQVRSGCCESVLFQ